MADAEYMVREVVTDLGWIVLRQKLAADVAHNSAKFKSTKPRFVTTCLTVSKCIMRSLGRRLRSRLHRRMAVWGTVMRDGYLLQNACDHLVNHFTK